jgi:hypothetical protein
MPDKCLKAKDLLAPAAVNHNAPGLTDAEIAEIFGVSRARIIQLRLRALWKIRRAVLEDPVLRQLAQEVCGHSLERNV